MILSDNETKVDLLNNEAIAKTIVTLLRERPEQPVTIGVHGDWGAGKSSVLEMIESGLNSQKDVLCLKFNGWRFQGFEDAKIALIEGIVTGLIEKRPILTKTSEAVKNIYHRIDKLKAAKKVGGLALTAFAATHGFGIHALGIPAIMGAIEGWARDPATFSKENAESVLSGVKDVLKPAEPKNVPEEIGAFRKAFDDLLKQAGIDQLVVLIDDLDRCLPDTAIETLEAVRLFVFTGRTAFVVAADEAMIEYAVRKHFPELPDTTGPRDYARNYLEKLIQVPFRIPALGETETRIYVTLLLTGAELGEADPSYINLIAAARGRLKRPWASSPLDGAAIRAALGDKAPTAQNALTLSDQIGPILASGAKGNPRQIKRFLNMLLLRHRTAEARGFGDDVKLPVLAKLMLAERFLPRLFDQIANASGTHPDGRCEELAILESHQEDKIAGGASATKAQTKPRPASDSKVATVGESPTDSPVLAEWLSSQPIGAWAKVKPALADVDLRPYLFISKDRKDYFGATSTLGNLAVIVEQLLGPRFSVQALEGELRQLAPPEAAQVFEALRGRVVGGDTFDTEPAGIAGMTVLVRAHPALQASLVDLLEALPRDRCGAWAVKGWEGVIKDAGTAARFARLLENWAASPKNPFLKTAASGALKARSGTR